MTVANTLLLRYGNNYSHKKFYSTGLWRNKHTVADVIKLLP